MKIEERIEIYNQAENKWGKNAQFDQAVEELAELIVAINKFKRKLYYGEYSGNQQIEDNLLEELCDSFMCIEQIKNMIFNEKDFNIRLDEKLEKLQKLLKTAP